MNDKEYYRDVLFISDQPALSDEFCDKPHQRVADTLSSILKSSEGGKAIGLEGTWGSGKSTVVDIVKNHLEKDCSQDQQSNYVFFVFDAWAHQSDPLRKVFLQEFIQKLESKKAIDSDQWTHELEKIETRYKRTNERRAEELSWLARVIILILPLFPIAYFLVHDLILPVEENHKRLLLGFMPSWVLGLIIILTPYACALFVLLTWRKGWQGFKTNINKIFTKEWWSTKDEREGQSVLWAFRNQTDQVTTEQLIKEKEATSIEFNSIFDRLVKESKNNNCKIIIVVDNLDRLPNDLIREHWATMRNFFASTPNSERSETLKNVWVIVPFDRVHIKEVFEQNNKDEEDIATPGFIEKTFEIILRIPPPILSNWHDYLAIKLKSAFGSKINEKEIYKIFRIFEIYQKERNKKATPRAIKAFINTIIASAKQWGNLIPLEHQALYAIYKDEIPNHEDRLRNSTLINNLMETHVYNGNWVKSLSAAYYNVEPNVALQLLLIDQIEAAIRNEDVQKLEDMKNTSGFLLMLHDCISENSNKWLNEEPNMLFNCASVLGQLSIDKKIELREIKDNIIDLANNITAPITDYSQPISGIKEILSNCDSERRVITAKKLVNIFCNNLSAETASNNYEMGKAWYELMSSIDEKLDEEYKAANSKEVFNNIELKQEINFVFGVAECAGEGGPISFNVFINKIPTEDLTNRVLELITEDKLSKILQSVIDSFLMKKQCVNWNSIQKSIHARLNQNQPPLSSSDSINLVKILSKIGSVNSNAKEVMKEFSQNGVLQALFNKAMSDNNKDGAAVILIEIIKCKGSDIKGETEHPVYGNLVKVNAFIDDLLKDPDDKEFIDQVSYKSVENGVEANIIRLSLSDEEDKELFRRISKNIVERDIYKKLFVEDVITRTSKIEEILGKLLMENFIKKFDDYKIDNEVLKNNWNNIDVRFLELTYEYNTDKFTKITDYIGHELNKLSKDEWEDILDNEKHTLTLLFKCIDSGIPPKLNNNFYDALKSNAESIISASIIPASYFSEWHKLFICLNKYRQHEFYIWLRDKLISQVLPGDRLSKILKLYGNEFTDNAKFEERAEDVIRFIIDPVLAERNNETVNILSSHKNGIKAALFTITSEQKRAESDRLSQLYNELDGSMKPLIETLGREFGLKIKIAPNGDADN